MSTTFRRMSRPNGYTFSLAKRRTWYADEPPATPATATPAPGDKSGAVDSSNGDEPPDWVKDPVKAYKEIRSLREEAEAKRKEARDTLARLEKLEDASKKADKEKAKADEAKLAEDKKWEDLAKKYKADLEKAEQDLTTERFDRIKERIGNELKLPAKLVVRLQGATEDELRADATELAKELGLDKSSPAPEQTPATEPAKTEVTQSARGQQTTTAVPGGQPVGRTNDDRKKEFFGGAKSSNIFQGAKVVYHGNPKDLE